MHHQGSVAWPRVHSPGTADQCSLRLIITTPDYRYTTSSPLMRSHLAGRTLLRHTASESTAVCSTFTGLVDKSSGPSWTWIFPSTIRIGDSMRNCLGGDAGAPVATTTASVCVDVLWVLTIGVTIVLDNKGLDVSAETGTMPPWREMSCEGLISPPAVMANTLLSGPCGLFMGLVDWATSCGSDGVCSLILLFADSVFAAAAAAAAVTGCPVSGLISSGCPRKKCARVLMCLRSELGSV